MGQSIDQRANHGSEQTMDQTAVDGSEQTMDQGAMVEVMDYSLIDQGVIER